MEEGAEKLNYYLYKFSIKPLQKARRHARAYIAFWIVLIIGYLYIFYSSLILGFDPNISRTARLILTGIMAIPFFFVMGYLFWFTGQFKMTKDGIFHKEFPFSEKLIPWSSITNVQRTMTDGGRSSIYDLFVICLNQEKKATTSPKKKRMKATSYYFWRQKRYFVIIYSTEREEYLIEKGFQIMDER